jgi:D-alanyl-lipoteichoic acid acyltransferase DltB (MBOAT superfamily)
MLFNSGIFLQFFAAFLLLYWLLRNNLRARNILIVLASYLFYGWWDYRFLALLVFSSVLDYFVGLGISRQTDLRRRKLWLACSVVANLTILGFFKYFDFFILSFAALMKELNIAVSVHTLGIILPVGISFYTFQAMSYTIDVYRREIPATRSLINFLAYVSFFPQLVAGPIERAHHLLPQFDRTLSITRPMLLEGIWLMLWGMFKKVFIADNLDPLVAMVYGSGSYSAPVVLLATIAFAFQIYCDFSGYSDIARGTARVLGFDIMFNFKLPYAAVSIREFWRRWHISLSTWLRDYLYISLGGNRAGKARTYANLWITMVLGGLWHGAAWNFVSWGMWHAVGLMLNRAFGDRTAGLRPAARTTSFFSWLVTMSFVLYGWLLFRARS